MRVHARLFADLENRVRLRRGGRTVADLHLAILREVIALRGGQLLFGRADVIIGMFIGRGRTTDRHASHAKERQHGKKSCLENRGRHRSFPFFHQGKGSSPKTFRAGHGPEDAPNEKIVRLNLGPSCQSGRSVMCREV